MSYSSEVLADSPLLYVRFEETAGATCANDGSLGGNATAAGGYTRNISTGLAGLGVGIDVDGTNGVVTYPDTASLDITGDVTYECWLNPDLLSLNVCAMSKGLGGGGAGYALLVQFDGKIRIQKTDTTLILASTSILLTVGTWTHIAFTRSGNTYNIYKDGSSVDSTSNSTAITATDQSFAIGHKLASGTAASFFNGKIDEVAVYNTALSGARLAAHYAARNTGAPAAPTFVPQTIVIT